MPPRHIARTLLLIGLLAGGLACADGVGPDPGPSAEERVHAISFAGPYLAWTGMSIPLRFTATDSGGVPVAGAQVDLEPRGVEGNLSVTSVVTDSAGQGEVTVDLVEPGICTLVATARGTEIQGWWIPTVAARPSVVYMGEDPRRIGGRGCLGALNAAVLDQRGNLILASSVQFTPTNPGVVSFFSLSYTGNYRGMRTGLRGESVGSTSIITTHGSGEADTALVEVAPDTLREVAIVERDAAAIDAHAREILFPTAALGDTLQWEFRPANQCGRHIAGLSAEWTSTDPSVATIEDSAVVVRGHGVTSIIVTAGGVADTAVLRTVDIEPRRVAIAVGDTVAYRLSWADDQGVLHPDPDVWVHWVGSEAEAEVVRRVMVGDRATNRLVAVQAGTARVHLGSNHHFGLLVADVVVVEP